MGRHDAAWLAKVEAHVREAKAGEALRRHGPGGGGAHAAAAAAAREAWHHKECQQYQRLSGIRAALRATASRPPGHSFIHHLITSNRARRRRAREMSQVQEASELVRHGPT